METPKNPAPDMKPEDFMPKPIKLIKRIDRIRKGDKIIVEMLPEDLQEMFNNMDILTDEAKRSDERDKEEKTEDSRKAYMLATYAAHQAYAQFWIACHERFGRWRENMSIRDNYALVTVPASENKSSSRLASGIIKIIKKKIGEDFDLDVESDD